MNLYGSLLCEISLFAFFFSGKKKTLCMLYLEFSRVLLLRERDYVNLYCRGARKAINDFYIHLG